MAFSGSSRVSKKWFRVSEGGTDGVTPDARPTGLGGDGAREVQHRALRERVDALFGQSVVGGQRADVDDVTRALLLQVGERGVTAVPDAADVHVEDEIEGRLVGVLDVRGGVADARVVDDHDETVPDLLEQ